MQEHSHPFSRTLENFYKLLQVQRESAENFMTMECSPSVEAEACVRRALSLQVLNNCFHWIECSMLLTLSRTAYLAPIISVLVNEYLRRVVDLHEKILLGQDLEWIERDLEGDRDEARIEAAYQKIMMVYESKFLYLLAGITDSSLDSQWTGINDLKLVSPPEKASEASEAEQNYLCCLDKNPMARWESLLATKVQDCEEETEDNDRHAQQEDRENSGFRIVPAEEEEYDLSCRNISACLGMGLLYCTFQVSISLVGIVALNCWEDPEFLRGCTILFSLN